MAVKIARKRRKNADGSYDIVHYETQAKAVWLDDGRSVEEAVGGGDSGGGSLAVKVVYSDATNSYSADKTFAEIKAAYDAGMHVVAVDPDNAIYVLSYCKAEDMAIFVTTYLSSKKSDLTIGELRVSSQNVWTHVWGALSYAPAYAGGGATDYTTYRARYISLQQDSVTAAPANGELVGVYTIS